MAFGWMLDVVFPLYQIMTIICYKYFLIKYNPFKKNKKKEKKTTKPNTNIKNKCTSFIYTTIVYDY